MVSITIRRLDENVKASLRVRAAHHGRSMEEEAREILKSALTTQAPPPQDLAQAIRQRIQPLGGIELAPPRREAIRRPPPFHQ